MPWGLTFQAQGAYKTYRKVQETIGSITSFVALVGDGEMGASAGGVVGLFWDLKKRQTRSNGTGIA